MGEHQIIITRQSSFYGCALKHSVELDGFSVGVLKNGGTLILNAQPGNHTISFLSRGKIEKTITILISPEDNTAEILVRLNGRQKLEITRENYVPTNRACPAPEDYPKKKKGHPVAAIICVLFIVFIIVYLIGSMGEDTPTDGKSPSAQQAEMEPTKEEQAAAHLEKATKKFESGDYIEATEICDSIRTNFPDTETAKNMNAYLQSQYDLFTHISAKDLMSEYDSNIVNADKSYTDTVMVVSGKVSSIGKTNNGRNLTVMLESGTYFYGVQLNFKTSQENFVAELREGDSVTVIGKCTGKSGKQFIILDGNNVMIENCCILS